MVSVYVLRLEQNKYYIGVSKNVYKRIQEHFNSNGSQWTKLYNPIDIVEVIPNCDIYDEDKYTKKYMFNYGIDNVRGGSYVTIKLEQNTLQLLNKEQYTIKNCCFKCGSNDHYINKCPNTSYSKSTTELETFKN